MKQSESYKQHKDVKIIKLHRVDNIHFDTFEDGISYNTAVDWLTQDELYY